MGKPELKLTNRPTGKLVYLPLGEVPEIPVELIEFLEKHIPNVFPNIIDDNRDALIHYQGKLDLIAELKYLYEVQQMPLDFDEEQDHTIN